MKKVFLLIFNWLKTHKILIIVVIAAILVANFVVKPRVEAYLKGPAEKYETVKAKKQDLLASVSASGEIVAEDQVTLRFQTSGKLAWVGVKKGDHVNQWQALASLDKEELKQTLKKELNDYMNERWDFEQDRDDYNITTDNLHQQTITDEVKRILEKAQFDLNNTVIDVEIADLAIRLATLVSPIEGIITEIEAPVAGVNVTPATAEITVANPDKMKFVANVDEADIANIKLGQKTAITLDAYLDQEFEGTIDKIGFSAVTTSGGGTAFPVEIFLPENDNQRFKVGMNGDTEIILDSRENVLTIPIEVIKYQNGNPYVEVIVDKKVQKLEVTTGLESETDIEILNGLSENQLVIVGEKKK